MSLLNIKNMSVVFETERGSNFAVENFDLTIDKGEAIGIVGESGSGKSMSMLALMGLVPFPGKIIADEITYNGQDLRALTAQQRRKFINKERSIIGKEISMIFQEPMTSLNPCFTVGRQLMEVYETHYDSLTAKEMKFRVLELLEKVGIPSPEKRFSAYPHQLSGGMCQRIMIAMAIACKPKILIADEPTTALDVTIQAQILDLIVNLQKDEDMALILISHNMGVISERTQNVAVMYAGQIMEKRTVDALFQTPHHPYSEALLKALPERSLGQKRLHTIKGTVPSLQSRPKGCLFSPRCDFVQKKCQDQRPLYDQDCQTRCYFPLNIDKDEKKS